MITEKTLITVSKLYKKIFNESVENSKEFTNFTEGNPHPLRIKVEDMFNQTMDYDILSMSNNPNVDTQPLVNKMDLLMELDTIIMTYIDNNYV